MNRQRSAIIFAKPSLPAASLPAGEGQGIADVLFGDYLFSGKLPYTWPHSMDQLPFNVNHMARGDNTLLFPFGYGFQ